VGWKSTYMYLIHALAVFLLSDTSSWQLQPLMSASTDGRLMYLRETCAGELGIQIVKHPDDVAMPDMTDPGTAYQMYDPDENRHDSNYDFKLRLKKPIYLAGHNPHMLARAVMDAGRQVRPDLLP
jgi:hypothetical protein